MRVIIAGSRYLMDEELVFSLLDEVLGDIEVSTVLCGCAKGVDTLGALWAEKNGIPVSYYPANWRRFGRSAGPLRNREMAENADALVCIYYPNSQGSANMILQAEELGLKILLKKEVKDG